MTPIAILLFISNSGAGYGTLGAMLGLVSKFVMIFLALMLIRFYCELFIVIFKINENVSKIRNKNEPE